jgi:hypothetical protein
MEIIISADNVEEYVCKKIKLWIKKQGNDADFEIR